MMPSQTELSLSWMACNKGTHLFDLLSLMQSGFCNVTCGDQNHWHQNDSYINKTGVQAILLLHIL